ncbi:hypothetical protein EYR40_008626 [Pleurotus pulmonarius]|nr:hypothetical protein EYR36_009446 [Pleurotus pulmonarius]KAF4593832.1 hypothetical protein EYR40_008626 [Pleurotus pulmonarius]
MSTPNCIADSVALPPFKVLMSRQRRARMARYAWLILRILCMANILLLIMLIVRALEKTDSLVYSPAQDIVQYEIKRFNTGFMDEHPTVFQGPPTDAMDEAWRELYERGVSYLLPEEANQLKELTIHAPGSNVFIGGLDVFHQLHCLVTQNLIANIQDVDANSRTGHGTHGGIPSALSVWASPHYARP